MIETTPEIVLWGISVTGGVAIGPAWFHEVVYHQRTAGSVDDERQSLTDAIRVAQKELGELSTAEDELARDILEFQIALLEDEDFLEPVFVRIDGGTAADEAWRVILDEGIADYASGEDEYLAARAADLVDLRDRVLQELLGRAELAKELSEGAILLADDLTPSVFLGLDLERLGGLALFGGSSTSHVALLARARGVPMVVGLGRPSDPIDRPSVLGLDADAGSLAIAPSSSTLKKLRERLAAASNERHLTAIAARQPARTAHGKRIQVLVNIDDPTIIDAFEPDLCDGVGLTRTEFLFARGKLPDEDEQYDFYARLIRWADGRPVTIRTLDAGGDKPVAGVTISGETNPFLGVRGLRLSLRHPDLFRVQLRALGRAAALGPLKIMVPMVTNEEEITAAEAHLEAAIAELARDGIDHATPSLGIMVETPAAALSCGDWDVDFLSIGSNDLIQYVTAAARDNAEVAGLADPMHPAVLELIGRTIGAGRASNVEVSLCGDMASTPELVLPLLDLGLEQFSVAPAQIGPIKRAIAESPIR